MVIGIITADLNRGAGWGRYATHLVEGLKRQGHTVLVCTEDDGDQPIVARGFGIFLSALRVAYFFRRVDVIHALDVYPFGVIAWLATRIIRRPLVLSGIGTYSVAPLLNRLTAWITRRACNSANSILAISSYTAERMRAVVPRATIHVVTPGMPQGFQVVEREGMPLKIISVGALKARKGYDVALKAFALAKKQIPSLTYTIIGDTNDRGYYEYLQSLVRTLALENSVTFKSHVSDDELIAEYNSAGVFLLCSVNIQNHFEGFGLVFLEAAAAGLPVIGTTGNGISDAVGPDNGILIPQLDVDATARAIMGILGDEIKWHHMSEASIVWARKNPVSNMIASYERVYKELA